MKASLKLNNPLWQTNKRRAILDRVVNQSGAQLENLVKQKILTGPKSGKLYRLGAIKKQIARRDLSFFRSDRRVFRRTFTSLTNEKTTVGYKVHRASAPGQSPASDSGRLAGSVRATRLGFMSVKVATSVRYAAVLDNGSSKRKIAARPFFRVTVEEFKPLLKGNLQEAIAQNS